MFNKGICRVPVGEDRVRSSVFIYNDTTRSVCRELCSRVHGEVCSSVLFDSRTQSCALSSDTGNQARDPDCEKVSGREFYRRRRKVGKDIKMCQYQVSLCKIQILLNSIFTLVVTKREICDHFRYLKKKIY